ITLALAGYVALFCPQIRRSPARMAGVGALLGGAVAVACIGTAADPALAAITAIAPTVFVAIITHIASDRPLALALGVLHGILVCIATDKGIGTYSLIIAGVAASIWHLRELRHRNALFKMSMHVGAVLAIGTVIVGFIDRPIDQWTVRENVLDAGL